ncbi:hypothetical protein ACTI_50280 [Actinoplanes sp. OR16]|uniref:hypothetical protein n=1 Tax=Actinoplanes sp. OR16 TaxID=946334 RepID=UPI000F6C62C4|nr:hypothetical protein [Actinoplanes sp. OR16]BBH68343.1 hypothetical protein ACTI_50280 [Actinoplanes sp. OR16]
MAHDDVSTTNLLITEYERLKEEQKTRIGVRDNLIYATLGSMAAVTAATLASRSPASLLLLPPVCVVLGWTYLVNDEKVSAIGRYIRDDLGPRLDPTGKAFGWETAHRSDRRRRSRKLFQLLVDLATFWLPAVVAVILYWSGGALRAPLVAVSVVELVVVTGLAVEVIRYADLGTGTSSPPSASG